MEGGYESPRHSLDIEKIAVKCVASQGHSVLHPLFYFALRARRLYASRRLGRLRRRQGPGGLRGPQAPCNPCPPRDCRNTLTRRPTGLARVARCAPKSPRANIQRLNISFSTTVSRWYCAARREASAVGGKAALRMKTAAISPERSEGSSRSKRRAALGNLQRWKTQAGYRGCKGGEGRQPLTPCPRRRRPKPQRGEKSRARRARNTSFV